MESPRKKLKRTHDESSSSSSSSHSDNNETSNECRARYDTGSAALHRASTSYIRSEASRKEIWPLVHDPQVSPNDDSSWSLASASAIATNFDDFDTLRFNHSNDFGDFAVGSTGSDYRNPYWDNAEQHLPRRHARMSYPLVMGINSYIKIRIWHNRHANRNELYYASRDSQDRHEESSQAPNCNRGLEINNVLPNNYGLPFHADDTAARLWKFYAVGFCNGRTLLKGTNSWYNDFTPMGNTSELVRYTILALASTYVHEFFPSENIRARANRYYRDAVHSLDVALARVNVSSKDEVEAIIGAIALFNMHDVVAFELRRGKDEMPRWLEGARLASRLLDASDPGRRYRKARNVQMADVRKSNATIIARAAIFALPLIPLDRENMHSQYSWLLYGDQDECHKIHGASGLSPKLMHMWAQVSYLCIKLEQEPDSPVLITSAEFFLESKLANFRQWSELSKGPQNSGPVSLETLLQSCRLNDDGVVGDPASMTDLGGQAWVAALKVYLMCRLLRMPRNHSKVFESMSELAECIKRMPTSGDLFTAQIPLLPVFLLGLLSVRNEHRAVARNWFDGVIGEGEHNCRSSVIPLWPALKRIWHWLDELVGEGEGWSETTPLAEREPWWEKMVAKIKEEEGTLCLI